MKNIVCPVSKEIVNESVARTTAFITILLVAAGFVSNSVLVFVFLLADFYVRAFTNLKFSPLSYMGSRLVNTLNFDSKPVGKAPKIFAARLGFVMTLIITVLLLLNLNIAALAVGGVLAICASLEFVFGICLGCIIYTYIVLPFYK